MDLRLTDERLVLPEDLREKIEAYWRELLNENSKLTNGEVFTVASLTEDSKAIHIQLAETDYAHFVYSRRIGGLGRFAVSVIFPTALVVTSDNKLIVGEMNRHTSLSGTIQSCSGGVDYSAVDSSGVVDIDTTIRNELSEELGITSDDERVAYLRREYLGTGGEGGHMTLAYVVQLLVTSDEFLRVYELFVNVLKNRGEEPEFARLFSVDNEPAAIDAFIELYKDRLNEFMFDLLRAVSDKEVITE